MALKILLGTKIKIEILQRQKLDCWSYLNITMSQKRINSHYSDLISKNLKKPSHQIIKTILQRERLKIMKTSCFPKGQNILRFRIATNIHQYLTTKLLATMPHDSPMHGLLLA